MTGLDKITCQTLVVHAREDELTSLRSATYLVEQIGGRKHAGRARMVVLEDSYHMICVDNDREIVAKNVLEFFGANAAGSLGMSDTDAGMDEAAMGALLAQVQADLSSGDFAALYGRGIPDFAWFQPGVNRTSGIHRGSKGLARLQAWSGGVSFSAFGAPSFNTGMAVVPATLQAGGLASQGVLAVAMRRGKLLEARWFPDDAQPENAHFGGEPASSGPSPAEQAFEAASVTSKTLRKAPDNDTLLALYSLYKQGSMGDATGARPGVMDMVGRAKFDAWAARRGTPREEAMAAYVKLVEDLKAKDAA
jgi:carboxylesterase